ncbi:MAG: UDP-N-acetylglucosamine 1-carboxyvinyltransferase [Candidatus Daviesbacteria bacterium]|nr:UDP-N-acetylglucosamine 1-carboxyvinyltransferase [Candidatus Daviesbacteria bacterium]
MAQYIIEGGNKLKGRVKISGNKNEVLPCLAACLLTEEEVILKNVPQTADVESSLAIFQDLGVGISKEDGIVRINCQKINKTVLKTDLANKLRASILFVGPLLARFGKVEFPHPGGCVIGRRSIDTHLDGFKHLGFKFNIQDVNKGSRNGADFKDQEIFLDEPSVTATENMILTSTLLPAVTTVKNCAVEPHVVGLCKMLKKMGAEIDGIGTQTIKISGGKKLSGCEYTIGLDNVEFGTYAIAAAVTNGEIEIEGDDLDGLEPIIRPFEKMGVKFEKTDSGIKVSAGSLKAVPQIRVNVWPGFPTDMMSAAIVLATQSKGVTLCHDWMYESRMFFVDKLITMGANITLADPHRVIVSGCSKLRGKNLDTPDLRAGMALVLAALSAKGTSVINKAELIERGYEDVVYKLTELGASIKRVE